MKTVNKLEEVEDIESFDGVVLYMSNPNNQKNVFTNICEHLESNNDLIGSQQFAVAAKISDGDRVKISVVGVELERTFKIDKNLNTGIKVSLNYKTVTPESLKKSVVPIIWYEQHIVQTKNGPVVKSLRRTYFRHDFYKSASVEVSFSYNEGSINR